MALDRDTIGWHINFDAERTGREHADRFWTLALACQKERGPAPTRTTEIGVSKGRSTKATRGAGVPDRSRIRRADKKVYTWLCMQ